MRDLCFLFIFIGLPLFSLSQSIEVDTNTGLYSRTEVLEFVNLSKDDLFNKTIEWVTLRYNSANDVIQLSDKENYKIIVKSIIVAPFSFGQTTYIRYTLIFDFKDEKSRCTYTSFSWANSLSNPSYDFERDIWQRGAKSMNLLNNHIQTAEENINGYIHNLVEYINSNDAEDW